MSEYKCEEPGCNFYIGTGGILSTELDFKKYYYYSQEVQDHFQMHDEQKRQNQADAEVTLLRIPGDSTVGGIVAAIRHRKSSTEEVLKHLKNAVGRRELEVQATEKKLNSKAREFALQALLGITTEKGKNTYIVARDNAFFAEAKLEALRELQAELLLGEGPSSSSTPSEADQLRGETGR